MQANGGSLEFAGGSHRSHVTKPFGGRFRQKADDPDRTGCRGREMELGLPIKRQIERICVMEREAPAWMRNCQHPSPLGSLRDGQHEAAFNSCQRPAKLKS